MSKFQTNGSPVVVIDSKQQKKHSALTVLLVAAIVAVLAVGGTFAYLTYTTNQATNEFSSTTGITADVLEPSWNAEAAQDMTPGDAVAKDPIVVNTSTSGEKELVAVKVEFKKKTADGTYKNMSETDLAKLLAVYAVTKNASTAAATSAGLDVDSAWTQITGTSYAAEGTRYYYYNNSIEAMTAGEADSAITDTQKTTALFQSIQFLASATQSQIDEFKGIFEDGVDPDWQIVISGAAVQAADGKTGADFVSGTDNWSELLSKTAGSDKSGVRATSGN